MTETHEEIKSRGFDWVTLSRNYSRREGTEMFSLTANRQVEKNSTFYRKRIENYILFYDVQIQVLEEMVVYGFVTKEFLRDRRKGFATQMKALMGMLKKEMESGELTEEQILQNEASINDCFTRVGEFLGERPVINSVAKIKVQVEDKVEESVVKEEKVEQPIVKEEKVEEKTVVKDDNLDDILL